MEKIQIAGMSGGGRYVKLKASKTILLSIREIFLELGDRAFEDIPEVTESLGNYDKWKDHRDFLRTNGFDAAFIYGDKYVHIVVTRGKNLGRLHWILEKYCVWVKPVLKKKIPKRK